MRKELRRLRDKKLAELEKEENMLREEIAKLRLEIKANKPKDTNTINKKRKTLAMLLTVITEKRELEKLQTNK